MSEENSIDYVNLADYVDRNENITKKEFNKLVEETVRQTLKSYLEQTIYMNDKHFNEIKKLADTIRYDANLANSNTNFNYKMLNFKLENIKSPIKLFMVWSLVIQLILLYKLW
jgi:hypothetical protein